MPLISVQGDKNTHEDGALLASNNTGKFFISGKKVVYKDSLAEADMLLHLPGATNSSGASSKIFCEGKPIHRHGDSRYCGATTIVTGQSKVTSG